MSGYRAIVNRFLEPVGLQLQRCPRAELPMEVKRGVATLIDVGTAYGTPGFYAMVPEAAVILIDALVEYRSQMDKIVAERGGKAFVCAVGRAPGELELLVEPGQLTKSSATARTGLTRTGGRLEPRKVAMRTLDSVVTEAALGGPYGLKIDCEGMELEVLSGAGCMLADTLFIVAEVSVARRFEVGYTFEEFIQALADLGFRVSNVLSANPGPDGIVRFVDLLFLKVNAWAAAPDGKA